jgi:hypothetical protein
MNPEAARARKGQGISGQAPRREALGRHRKEDTMTGLRTIAAGLAAGLVGTTAMTALQEVMAARRRRAGAATGGNGARPDDPWVSAPAPAQLARKVILGTTGRDVPAERIPLFTNAVHWGYGTSTGVLYGLVQRTRAGSPFVRGPLFGLGVWASSYATLVPLGLYKWPWHYRAGAIAKDVSYHLVYGSGVAAGYQLAGRRAR